MASTNIARLGVVLGLDTAEFTASIDKAIAINRRLGMALKRDNEAAAAEVVRLKQATDDYGKTLTQVELTERAISTGRLSGADKGLKDVLLSQAKAYDDVAKATKGAAGGMNAFQKQSLMYQTTDFFTQIASGQGVMIAAIQQGGQLKDTMGGLGNMFRMLGGLITPMAVGLSVLAVGVGAVGYGFYAGSQEAKEFQNNLLLTGNYANKSYTDILDLSKALKNDLNISMTDSKDAFLAMASSGQFTSDTFESVGRTIGLFSKLTGMTGTEAAQKLIPSLDGSASSARKLNDQYHFLTLAQYKQIEMYEKTNDLQKGITLTSDALNDSLERQTQKLGTVEKLWKSMGNIFSDIKNSLLDIGRPETSDNAIKRLNKEILDLTAHKTIGTGSMLNPVLRENKLAEMRTQLKEWQDKADAEAANQKEKEAETKKIKAFAAGGGTDTEIKNAALIAKQVLEIKQASAMQEASEQMKINMDAEKQTAEARADFKQKEFSQQNSMTSQNTTILNQKLTLIEKERLNKLADIKTQNRLKEEDEFQKTSDEQTKYQIEQDKIVNDWRIASYADYKSKADNNSFEMNKLAIQTQLIGATDLELKIALRHLDTLKEIQAVKENILLSDADKNLAYQRINDKEKMDSVLLTASDKFSKISEITNSVFGNMSSAIDDFVKTGKMNFKGFAQSVIQDLIAIQMKAQAMSLLNMAFKAMGLGGLAGIGGSGSGGGMTQSMFQMAEFADGGDPPLNVPSMVGERGPELFVPKSAGTIIPNNQLSLGGGGGTTVNYNGPYIASMSAVDTQSGVQFLAKNKQAVWATYQSANRSIPMSR